MKLFNILACMVIGAITMLVSLAMLVTAEHLHNLPMQLISLALVITGGLMFFGTPIVVLREG